MASREQREPLLNHDFEPLFKRYYGALVGFFLSRGESRAESEDLAQETLFRALKGLKQFQQKSSTSTWIFTIAGNLWLNLRREREARKRQSVLVPLDSLNEEPGEIQEGPPGVIAGVDLLVDGEKKARLHESIRQLPPQMKRVVLLRLKDFEYSEIAEICGIKLGTAKSLFFQAKERLEEILRKFRPELFETEDKR